MNICGEPIPGTFGVCVLDKGHNGPCSPTQKSGITISLTTETDHLKSLLRRVLAELEYFKNKYDDFRPLLMSEIKRELGK